MSRRHATTTFSVLIAGLLLAACAGGADTTREQSSAGMTTEERARRDAGNAETCRGSYARGSRSESYLPGAPEVREDGDTIELVLRVVANVEGRCVPAEGALIEIWHTGDSQTYSPDKWRTALRTGEDGVVSYRTVRPAYAEGQPHFHVRGTFDDEVYEWVIGVLDAPDATLERTLVADIDRGTQSIPGTTILQAPGV